MPRKKQGAAAQPRALRTPHDDLSRWEGEGGALGVPREVGEPVKAQEARRYAPETDEMEAETEPMNLRGINIPAMNEAQLRQFAMQHFGRRFQEGEKREYIMRDVMNRMDVGHRSRNA